MRLPGFRRLRLDIPIPRPNRDRHVERAAASWRDHPFRQDEQIAAFVDDVCQPLEGKLREAFAACVRKLIVSEEFCPPALTAYGSADALKRQLHNMSGARLRAAKTTLAEAACLIAKSVPNTEGAPIAIVPLASVLTYAHLVMQKVVYCLQHAKVAATGQAVFPALKDTLLANAREKGGNLVNPTDRLREPAETVAGIHFAGTPLLEFLTMRVALRMPTEKRFEHALVLGKSGRGKTHLLQNVIYRDLLSQDRPAIVVIEPKGDMARALGRLELFKERPERLLIIDGALTPPLNMFKVPPEAVSEMIKQYAYILGGIEGEKRSQSGALAHVARLVIARGKGLQDFLDILTDPARKIEDSRFGEDMLRYGNDLSRTFFKGVFYGQYSVPSRQSLAGKVLDLMDQDDGFAAMFGAHDNVANMFERIETPGTLTIISTAQGALTRSSSSIMGRWFIGQTIAAALRRGTQLERHRKPAYLVVDEAHDYFDGNLGEMLRTLRSYRLGVTLATNSLKEARGAGIEDALLGKTEIKLVSPSSTDAKDVAPHAGGADASFYSSLRQQKGVYSEFAYYDGSQGPMRIRTAPFEAPQISDVEFDEMRERFRGVPREQPAPDLPLDPSEGAEERDGVIEAVVAEMPEAEPQQNARPHAAPSQLPQKPPAKKKKTGKFKSGPKA